MKRIVFIILTTLLSAPTSSFAQKGVITGTVSTENGEALPGANVVVVDQDFGTATDPNGKYKIERITPGDHILSVSFVGYKEERRPVEVESGETLRVNFQLRSAVPPNLQDADDGGKKTSGADLETKTVTAEYEVYAGNKTPKDARQEAIDRAQAEAVRKAIDTQVQAQRRSSTTESGEEDVSRLSQMQAGASGRVVSSKVLEERRPERNGEVFQYVRIQATVQVEVSEKEETPTPEINGPDPTHTATIASPTAERGGSFGTSVSHIGDINGDGVADLLVGSPGASVEGKENAGRAYVLDGDDRSVLASYSSPNSEPNGRFGASASVARSPEGTTQLVIGAPGEPVDEQRAAGRTYVYRIRSGQTPTPPSPTRPETAIPETQMSRPNGVAVVIGVESYQKGLSEAKFAVRDSRVVREYLTQTLGFPEENIISIQNATGAELKQILGTDSDPNGRLSGMIKPGESEVFVYFSGRAQWGSDSRQPFLIGSDTDPDYLSSGGYPVNQLYENLANTKAKSVNVVIDAPITGTPSSGLASARLTVENPFMTLNDGLLLTAGEVGQERGVYPKKRQGLFTHFFLKALRGAADRNGDQTVTGQEVGAYLKEKVPHWSDRLHSKNQTPHVIGGGKNRVLVKYDRQVPVRQE